MAKGLSLPTDPASQTPEAVMKALHVSAGDGLAAAEVQERLEEFGLNELPAEQPTPFWKLVLQQFEDTLVRILLLAALISFCMAVLEGDASGFVEPFVILLILVLNATVGVWQENRAEDAIDALKSFVPSTAVVIRDGEKHTINAENVVPGDIVEIAVGNRIPADMRLLELHSTTFRVDQAILNGESVEAIKFTEAIKGRKERFPGNMAYSGTAVVYGKAIGVVVRTGSSTEIGSIERSVREQEESKTPLQIKLDEFGVLLSKVIGYICLAVFAVNMIHWYATRMPNPDEPWYEHYVEPTVHCLKVAVALAVAAIPEGLPAVVTTCLALGTRRMARHNALVRDLPSVETLGRCTVICSDKTGTLTTNMMSVLRVFTLNNAGGKRSAAANAPNVYEIKDSKFNVLPGAVSLDGAAIQGSAIAQDQSLNMLCHIAVMCNDASLSYIPEKDSNEKIGEATEAALLTMSEKLAGPSGVAANDVNAFRKLVENRWTKNTTLEFTRKRKSMSVHCSSKASPRTNELLVKGAPEEILERCSRIMYSDGTIEKLTATTKAAILAELHEMTGNALALRCLGFAFKEVPSLNQMDLTDPDTFEDVESDLKFVGVAGMQDPPREEVREAIEKCHTAGIRVVVITGDSKDTAEAICRKIGLFAPGEEKTASFTGYEFDAMTMAQKRAAVVNAKLFSRTDPSHKMQLVQLYQDSKLIVAMTGDGVNDAPALKKADIGIAMGTGTEVAKGASKMVLADDNFATVVKAVREGRAIFNNTKQFIRYLISSNIGEVVCVLLTGLIGIPEALAPVQLLWVNLVTDGLPATALGFNSPDPDIMEQAPRAVDEPIVNGWLFFRYMVIGTYVGFATVAGFLWWFLAHGFTITDLRTYTTCVDMSDAKCVILANPETARAIALSILVVVEMLNALNALSENQSLVDTRPSTNPWLLIAIASSLILHVIIMYVPFFAATFSITPLGVDPAKAAAAAPWSVLIPENFDDWKAIFAFSIPIIFIDEILKFVTRRALKGRKAHA